MDRIDTLLAAMTLEEKVGQLTMLTAELVNTGPALPADDMEAIREGRVGSLFNCGAPDRVREVQRMAVEETRLKIPLIFGFDVIHGQRTFFRFRWRKRRCFDPALWEPPRGGREECAGATGST